MGSALNTEEATKTALVLPFIAALGYDVFNPSEVVPEFAAPIGEYKDARVDYAILVEGKPILLIECKAFGTQLESKQCNQLQLYFHGTEAPIAILTDGNRYRFFSKHQTAWMPSPIWNLLWPIWTKHSFQSCVNWPKESLIAMHA